MSEIYVSKQKIFDVKKDVFAYELVFKDDDNKTTALSNNVKDTAKLIMSSITSSELDKLLGRRSMAFINVDEVILTKGILDVLDKDRFILNILEDIKLTEEVISKIVQYRLDELARKRCQEVVAKITYVELNVNQEFMIRFSGSRFIPHTDHALFPSVPIHGDS